MCVHCFPQRDDTKMHNEERQSDRGSVMLRVMLRKGERNTGQRTRCLLGLCVMCRAEAQPPKFTGPNGSADVLEPDAAGSMTSCFGGTRALDFSKP